MNTFGKIFRLTTFGESHGPCIGGVLDGCPAGLQVDRSQVQEMLRRRASQGGISTPRKEPDEVEFLSGLTSEYLTTGTPIAFTIRNANIKSGDYAPLKELFRPSHADYTYSAKYGLRISEGGGRSSARETVARVVAGAIASQFLREIGIEICSYTSQVGDSDRVGYNDLVTLGDLEDSLVGCPIPETDRQMYGLLQRARQDGDTLGGSVTTIIRGVPPGWGEPLYDKLHARLSYALLSINAARGFEIGDGIDMASMRGSESNDPFTHRGGQIRTKSNHSGGIQGGISNGETIRMRTYFKPISSIAKPQETVDADGRTQTLTISGRHDASVIPRVLPVCDAMAALTLADFALLARFSKTAEE